MSSTHPPSTCAVTVISANYLPFARVLFASLAQLHPEIRGVAVLVDQNTGYFDPLKETFEVLPIETLQIPQLPQFLFQYTLPERIYACKPYALQAALQRHPECEYFFYFDSDILICGPLHAAFMALEEDAILLTPSKLQPAAEGEFFDDFSALHHGHFNAGFLGLRRGPIASAFLEWWAGKCLHECVFDPARALFVDQRWLDLVPALFEGVHILRDPTYNVAPWNLSQRSIASAESGFAVAGAPLTFFHFAGYSPAKPDELSSYSAPGTRPALVPPMLTSLFARYQAALFAAGYESCRHWEPAYERFRDGTPIPPLWHVYYHDVLRERMPPEHDPFAGLPWSPVLELLKRIKADPRRVRIQPLYREWVRAMRYLERKR